MKWLGLLAVSALAAMAQSDEVRASAHDYTPPQLRLAVESKLVQVEAVVRDRHGRAIAGLKQTDFEIVDEGKPREIAAFSVESREAARAVAGIAAAATPGSPAEITRSTLLFFDDMHADSGQLRRSVVAAQRFIQDGLGPGARAGVFVASEGLVVDFTTSAEALTKAIGKLRPHPRISESGLQSCPRITPYQAYLIANNLDQSALNAAVQEAQGCERVDPNDRKRGPLTPGPTSTDPNTIAVRAQASGTWEQARRDSLNSLAAVNTALSVLGKAPGTRVLLLVSTGFLSGMLEPEMDVTIDRAIRTGIVINALDAKGVWAAAPGRPIEEANSGYGFPVLTFAYEIQTMGSRNDAMNAVMAHAASATGGLFFHNSNDLAGGFAQLAAVPETTYLLAFHPDAEGAGKYHKLKVRLGEKNGYYIQARPGYFLPANVTSSTQPRSIDDQVLAADVRTEIPIQVSTRLTRSDKGDREVSLAIHVDVSPLKFARQNGRNTQNLTFIGALLDSGGNVVAAKEGVVEFALRNETLPRLTASGLNGALSLGAPPGSYRVRVVVEDAEGKLASLNQTIEIPKQ
jgi:VWFA-related protein